MAGSMRNHLNMIDNILDVLCNLFWIQEKVMLTIKEINSDRFSPRGKGSFHCGFLSNMYEYSIVEGAHAVSRINSRYNTKNELFLASITSSSCRTIRYGWGQ